MDWLKPLIDKEVVSAIFLFAGLVLIFLEVFVPSGGVLGLTALACIIFGIYGLFHNSGNRVVAQQISSRSTKE